MTKLIGILLSLTCLMLSSQLLQAQGEWTFTIGSDGRRVTVPAGGDFTIGSDGRRVAVPGKGGWTGIPVLIAQLCLNPEE